MTSESPVVSPLAFDCGGIYDGAGNLTSWNGAAYEYDAVGMMKRYANGSQAWLHMYTADDERLWSFQEGANPRFDRFTLRDLGGKVLRTWEATNYNWTWTEDHVYRDGTVLASEEPSGRTHLHPDHLGTPRAVTNSAGQRIAYHAYYPFGEEATSIHTDDQRMKFTGHERDFADGSSAADDLDYMHARYYGPLLGRFTSPDPVGGVPSEPQSWNLYSYVLGNPLKYIDPEGLAAIDACSSSGSDDEYAGSCQGSIVVTGAEPERTERSFDPMTGVQGVGDLRSGRSLFAGLASLGGSHSSGQVRHPRSASDDAPGVIGFGCNDLLSPAASLGAAGGTLLGGAVDLLATPNRGELTLTVGFGVGAGVSVSPVGLSMGKSEGLGLGVATVLGMPAGLNGLGGAGISNFFGEETLAGANVGIGVGGGEAAAGGLTYTFVLYDRCQ